MARKVAETYLYLDVLLHLLLERVLTPTSLILILLFFAEPTPPTGVMFEITGIDTAVVSWAASQSMCDGVIGNYSVRYQLSNDFGATVYTNETSITLRGLIPNAEYSVFVAAINSRGDVSLFSGETSFAVSMSTANPSGCSQGMYVQNNRTIVGEM